MNILSKLRKIMSGPKFFRRLLRTRKKGLAGRPGLGERLAFAKTTKQIDNLLREGEIYKGASDQTQRMWDKNARGRRKYLEAKK